MFDNMAEYIITILALVSLIIISKYLKVKNLKFKDWIQVEFFPEYQKDYHICSLDKIGFVISKDNKIYKVHLKTTMRVNNETSFNNAQLFISGIGWFVIRLFFSENNNTRKPVSKNRIIKSDKVHFLNFEFEKKEGWEPLELKKKEYSSLLKVRMLDKRIKHKFTFQVRAQNIKNINNMKKGQRELPIIVEVPIIQS